jgi:hypothetical protein
MAALADEHTGLIRALHVETPLRKSGGFKELPRLYKGLHRQSQRFGMPQALFTLPSPERDGPMAGMGRNAMICQDDGR